MTGSDEAWSFALRYLFAIRWLVLIDRNNGYLFVDVKVVLVLDGLDISYVFSEITGVVGVV